MDSSRVITQNATIQRACLFRVQIPTDHVTRVLNAITNVTPLRYGNYEQVAFRHRRGIQQYKPLTGSKTGEAELTQISSDEISFAVPIDEQTMVAVIDAVFESHPHEEPVILIQEVMCTRFMYG